MKIVIDIPEELYLNVINTWGKIHPQITEILKNGTPTIGCYEQGYNAAKREIALSGEYQRAYNRGYEQACKDKIDTPYKEETR